MNSRGFSLIELLITMALVVVVAMLTSSLFSYINKSFDVANIQSELQWNARLAKTAIQKEIQNATSINILRNEDLPEQSDLGNSEKVIYVENGIIISRSQSGTDKPLISSSGNDVQAILGFENETSNLLKVTVVCQSGDKTFSLSSDFFVPRNSSGTTVISGTTGEIIRYTPPPSEY